ncbi:MAG: cellulase family glycosylhydrolase [Saprospiraceae bacterium]
MKIIFTFLFSMLMISMACAQHEDQIFVDNDGIMHWSRDSSEVTGFGENYTVPFAYGFRAAKRMGIDIKAAIDQDVYQFARLGFDLFRVHVWDCEISDTLGNLLDNEHLELFDYLLWKLKEKGINAVITPIAYWGNGWPEKDEPTPGFSTKYGKGNCLTNPDAIKAQEKYLYQFVNHINRYTGIAYKNDPQILAFEICNEPHHRGAATEVTAFVRKMKDAIQSSGCTKPILYNVSHAINYAQDYFDAGIDGGTFQWYPTGLGFQKELGGNMLPNVDKYVIPFDDVLKKNHAARFVYEFDAADMATSYMYPAMARSLRAAGMQMATHFAWDPTYTAPYNTEYNTHFMNLFYAPQKALSLMICGEIFRTIPLYTDFGVYPDNTSFGPFKVSYEENLAEMVTEEKFIYTNNTTSKPPAPEKLELIAGYGNSPLVEYNGTGAYFFDKLGDGIWKLELMPDAVIVDNLFGRNSLDKTRAVVRYNRRRMKINLPEYAAGFSIESVDWRDSILYRETKDGIVNLKPGIYLLKSPKYQEDDSIVLESKKQIALDEYFAPVPGVSDSVFANHDYTGYWKKGKDHPVSITIAASQKPKEVLLQIVLPVEDLYKSFEMKEVRPFVYESAIPSKYYHPSEYIYQYYFEIQLDSSTYFYPGRSSLPPEKKKVWNWGSFLELNRVENQFHLLDSWNFNEINKQWLPSFLDEKSFNGKTSDSTPIRTSIHIKLDSLVRSDPENLLGLPTPDYTLRHYFIDRYAGLQEEFLKKKVLVLNAKTSKGKKCHVQVSLIQKDGTGFGYTFEVNDTDELYYILLDELKPVPVVLMPRPYPTFLPYYSSVKMGDTLDMLLLESVDISIGPDIPKEDWKKPVDVFIKSVWLE